MMQPITGPCFLYLRFKINQQQDMNLDVITYQQVVSC